MTAQFNLYFMTIVICRYILKIPSFIYRTVQVFHTIKLLVFLHQLDEKWKLLVQAKTIIYILPSRHKTSINHYYRVLNVIIPICAGARYNKSNMMDFNIILVLKTVRLRALVSKHFIHLAYWYKKYIIFR